MHCTPRRLGVKVTRIRGVKLDSGGTRVQTAPPVEASPSSTPSSVNLRAASLYLRHSNATSPAAHPSLAHRRVPR